MVAHTKTENKGWKNPKVKMFIRKKTEIICFLLNFVGKMFSSVFNRQFLFQRKNPPFPLRKDGSLRL